MSIKETKIDHKTLHFLPFLPSRKRQKGFFLQREWGKWNLEISARETLNTYDLVTLLFMVREYLKHGYQAGFIGEGDNKREIAGININVKTFLVERGILNKKPNRYTLKKSLMRLKTINLTYIHKKTKYENNTSYIYEFDVDKDINIVKIYANKRFIDFIIDNGILINLERLLRYGNKEQYAILLDLYLQGTKRVTIYNGKKYLKYKEQYSNNEIEKALKLDITNLEQRNKIRVIKETFDLIHKKGKMPKYILNKTSNIWMREDINRHKRVK